MQNQVQNPVARRRTIGEFLRNGWNSFCSFFKRLSCAKAPAIDPADITQNQAEQNNQADQVDQVQDQQDLVFLTQNQKQIQKLSQTMIGNQLDNQPVDASIRKVKRPHSAKQIELKNEFKGENIVDQQQSIFQPVQAQKQQELAQLTQKVELSETSQPDVDLLNVSKNSKKPKNSESDLDFTKKDLGSFAQSEPHFSELKIEFPPVEEVKADPVKVVVNTSEKQQPAFITEVQPQNHSEIVPSLQDSVIHQSNVLKMEQTQVQLDAPKHKDTLGNDGSFIISSTMGFQPELKVEQPQSQLKIDVPQTEYNNYGSELTLESNNAYIAKTSSLVAKRNESNSPERKSSNFIRENDKPLSDFEDLSVHEAIVAEQPSVKQTVKHLLPVIQEEKEEAVPSEKPVATTKINVSPKSELVDEFNLNHDSTQTIIMPKNSKNSILLAQQSTQILKPMTATANKSSRTVRCLKPIRTEQNNEQANQM